MSISIYYEARRANPLEPPEWEQFRRITRLYSVDRKIEEYANTGRGLNWESFSFYHEFPDYQPSEPDLVLEGATRLPDNSEDAVWEGVQHWCTALSALRRAIPGAEWSVRIEDHEIPWDEKAKSFDPTR